MPKLGQFGKRNKIQNQFIMKDHTPAALRNRFSRVPENTILTDFQNDIHCMQRSYKWCYRDHHTFSM